MDIIDLTKKLQHRARQFGRYRYVAEQSGVNYEWLTKFANGKISNPGIENVDKLKKFFDQHQDTAA